MTAKWFPVKRLGTISVLGAVLTVAAFTIEDAQTRAATLECYQCAEILGCQNGACLQTRDEETGALLYLCCVGGSNTTFKFCQYMADDDLECITNGNTTECRGCYSFDNSTDCSAMPCSWGELIGIQEVENCGTAPE